ncbi:MAG: transcriptional regulator, partial [Marivirga sp.]|nr:transcriptional regulator [Marivirga sp.]
MKSHFIFLLLLLCGQVYSQGRSNGQLKKRNEQFNQLHTLIKDSEKIDEQKLIRVEELYQKFRKSNAGDQFESCLNLYQEYSLFRSDSAYAYANKLHSIAKALRNPGLVSYARIKLGSTLVSSGMLKEAIDSLVTVNADHLDTGQLGEYYALMARYYYDLADYTQNDSYRHLYNNYGGKYVDSALMVYPSNTFEYTYYSGLRNLRLLELDQASAHLKTLLNRPDLTDHELALTASTLSDIYIRVGQRDTAISLLIRAAMADIRSSTKETSALFNLSTLLFQMGDLENAASSIEKASDDANFYGSRQRKAQLSVILPLIKEEKLRALVNEKKNLFTYSMIITFSFVGLV